MNYQTAEFFALSLFGLSFMAGTGFTLGMMFIGKVFRWAPVNVAVMIKVAQIQHDPETPMDEILAKVDR